METAPQLCSDGNGSPALAYWLRQVLVVMVAATAILLAALAAFDSCLSPVWQRAMVQASSYLTVASAASDFGGIDGIGTSSNGIGCLDVAVASVVSNLDF